MKTPVLLTVAALDLAGHGANEIYRVNGVGNRVNLLPDRPRSSQRQERRDRRRAHAAGFRKAFA